MAVIRKSVTAQPTTAEAPVGCSAESGQSLSAFEHLTSMSNLWRCWQKTKKGKYGKERVHRFDANAFRFLTLIQQRLRDGTFQFGPYRYFEIVDKKRRDVVDSPMKDRVVHRAIYDHMTEIWNKRFIFDSYGNIKGKGTLLAVQRTAEFARKPENRYVLQLDISKFFYSVPHAQLKLAILRHQGDQRIRDLLVRLVDSFRTDDRYDHLFSLQSAYRTTQDKGMPLGNLTSQLFCNILLNDFDHYAKEVMGLRYYLRYVDDILVFGDSLTSLHMRGEKIATYLELLGLMVHPGKRVVRPVATGVPYLGMVIWPNHISAGKRFRKNYHRVLRKSDVAYTCPAAMAYRACLAHTGASR